MSAPLESSPLSTVDLQCSALQKRFTISGVLCCTSYSLGLRGSLLSQSFKFQLLVSISFEFSPSDVVSVVQFTARVYQGWKKACGEYSKVTGELETLEIILSRVAFEVQRPTSLLGYHDGDLKKLQKIIMDCTDVVTELEIVLSKYRSLRFSRRSNWDRIRFGNKDMSCLRERLKLQINALGTSSLGRMEDNVKLLPEMKIIIDKLAAEIRAGRREGSVMITYENDRKEVWRQFRRESISEGIQSDNIGLVKHHLRSYLKGLNEAGLMDEEMPEEINGLEYTPTEGKGLAERDAHENPQSKPFLLGLKGDLA